MTLFLHRQLDMSYLVKGSYCLLIIIRQEIEMNQTWLLEAGDRPRAPPCRDENKWLILEGRGRMKIPTLSEKSFIQQVNLLYLPN